MEKWIRSPIVVVLGHVDVGKTTLLDKIRGTAVALKEPGTMTQHIGASFLPWRALEKICGPLLRFIKTDIKIPGLLVIDTPGHEAFVNLRRRGGSIADIAILVIDINRGFEQQTYESIEILKVRKTPFLIAANKLDKLPGWKSHPGKSFIESVRLQKEDVVVRLEERLYSIIDEMRRLGFRSDRYDRIRDFTKVVAIVPTSAITGEGIPDLLMVLAGITQRFMLEYLKTAKGPAKGVVLEVKEEVGLGTTIDVIIYEGVLRKGDTIVVGGLREPVITKIRAILVPKPMDEMRSPEDRFRHVNFIPAAAGVKIVASNLDRAVAGAPIIAAWSEEAVKEATKLVTEEIASIRFQSEILGVVIKADTLGSLEALIGYVRRHNIPIRYADIGPVVKRDIVEASLVRKDNKYLGVILAFNVKVTEEALIEAKRNHVRIFKSNIIYRLLEDYLEWYRETKLSDLKVQLSKLIYPAKIQILPGYVFRRRNPAIVGIKVLEGTLKPGVPLMRKDGKSVGRIMQIQDRGNVVEEAKAGSEVAISIRGNIMIGRHVKEGDVLYVDVPFEHIEKLRNLAESMPEEDLKLLSEIEFIKIEKLRRKAEESEIG
ncbi:MAG: translation initiation factor IF-2 [Thermoprotei archaeon]|nr:MAG: translation initiation factor IF-2 [Thermoprotei archaeon]RLF02868.1 MAG: translation initiation factor IF-2 [Thermoprotei archaeon]